MATSKPSASAASSSSLSEDSVVQVLDSSEPLVLSASSGIVVQVLDSGEPLVPSASGIVVQVLDSGEPLVPSASGIVVCALPSERSPPGPAAAAAPSPHVRSPPELAPALDPPDRSLSEPAGVAPSRPDRRPSPGPAAAAPSPSDRSLSEPAAVAPSRPDRRPSPGSAAAAPSPSDRSPPPGPSAAAQPIPGSSGRRLRPYAEELRSQWNLRRVFRELGTQDDCVRFAEERELLPRTKMCPHHRRPMNISRAVSHGQLGMFRCSKSNCRTKPVSRAAGTWFENVHLALTYIFQIMYMFSHGYTYEQIQRETSDDRETVLSSKTIADWFSYCRETIIIYELENQNYENKIGGPNKIVQIDESKFGKRKYNRGRNIEGHWVLGMIEDGSDDLRLEVCPDNERSSEILVPLIKKHVAEGSIIHTDFLRAYDCLPQHGYTHRKVNHSDPENRFVAPDGTHTQRIESHWRGLKRQFQRDQYKGNFADWLVEFSWRRRNRIEHRDPFEELLSAVHYVYHE